MKSSQCSLMLDTVSLIKIWNFKYNRISCRNDWCLYVLLLLSVKTKLVMDGKSFGLSCSLGMEDDSLNLSRFLDKLFREVCSFDTPTMRHIIFAFWWWFELQWEDRKARGLFHHDISCCETKVFISFPFSLNNCPSLFWRFCFSILIIYNHVMIGITWRTQLCGNINRRAWSKETANRIWNEPSPPAVW